MNVKLTKTQRILVESSHDLARIMQQILLRENRVSRQREHFWTIGLGEKFNLLYVELVSLGSKGKVEPMEVFKLALQKDALYLYLCHNCPKPDLAPPKEYFTQTDRLIQVGNIVGITVHDHLVINAKTEDYLSFADVGHMEKLRKSTAWVPKFQQMKLIKKMAAEEAVKKRNVEVARVMKKNNVDVNIIIRATGLMRDDIMKL